MTTDIQTDPSRCWVRIASEDQGTGEYRFSRTLIGDAWALEPFAPQPQADEFSLAITVKRIRDTPTLHPSGASAGMRLDREQGLALWTALGQWLTAPRPGTAGPGAVPCSCGFRQGPHFEGDHK